MLANKGSIWTVHKNYHLGPEKEICAHYFQKEKRPQVQSMWQTVAQVLPLHIFTSSKTEHFVGFVNPRVALDKLVQ